MSDPIRYADLLSVFVVPPATVFRRLAFRKTTPKSLKAHVGFSVGRTLIRNASIPIMQCVKQHP